MNKNPLLKLRSFGQSIWLDLLNRALIDSGELKALIDEDGLSGVTSNPAIFEKAIDESRDYDEAICSLAREGKSAQEIYQALIVDDIRRAADILRPLYDRTGGINGFVSLEVSPHLADDPEGTVAEARQLWAVVGRPNLLIKVPATPAGLPAIRQIIAEGINVNVTLLFGLPRYRKVVEAYMEGLESRLVEGKSIERVASVASFFLSRIDVFLDPIFEELARDRGPDVEAGRALHGQVAIASAKMAYQTYMEVAWSRRFRRLAARGALPQRVLWASTGTKNPAYSDVKYVEPLIGPDTISTLPMETLKAYRDHGNPAPRLEEGVAEARRIMHRLPDLRINIDYVTQQLEDEGVEKFIQPYDKLMAAIERRRLEADGGCRRKPVAAGAELGVKS